MTNQSSVEQILEKVKNMTPAKTNTNIYEGGMVPMFSSVHLLMPNAPHNIMAYSEALFQLRDIKRTNKHKGDKKKEKYAPIKEWVNKQAAELLKLRPSLSKEQVAQKVWEKLAKDENKQILNGVALPSRETIKRYWLPKGKPQTWDLGALLKQYTVLVK